MSGCGFLASSFTGTISHLICPVPEVMVGMGFTREEIRDSLISHKYNEVMATYFLLGRKNEVCFVLFVCSWSLIKMNYAIMVTTFSL